MKTHDQQEKPEAEFMHPFLDAIYREFVLGKRSHDLKKLVASLTNPHDVSGLSYLVYRTAKTCKKTGQVPHKFFNILLDQGVQRTENREDFLQWSIKAAGSFVDDKGCFKNDPEACYEFLMKSLKKYSELPCAPSHHRHQISKESGKEAGDFIIKIADSGLCEANITSFIELFFKKLKAKNLVGILESYSQELKTKTAFYSYYTTRFGQIAERVKEIALELEAKNPMHKRKKMFPDRKRAKPEKQCVLGNIQKCPFFEAPRK